MVIQGVKVGTEGQLIKYTYVNGCKIYFLNELFVHQTWT